MWRGVVDGQVALPNNEGDSRCGLKDRWVDGDGVKAKKATLGSSERQQREGRGGRRRRVVHE